MPLIYSPRLEEVYTNTCYETSSIISSIVPVDYSLTSDGNGATFWKELKLINLFTNEITVEDTLSTNNLYTSRLDVSTVFGDTNTVSSIYASLVSTATIIVEVINSSTTIIQLTSTTNLDANNLETYFITNQILSTSQILASSLVTESLNSKITTANSIDSKIIFTDLFFTSSLSTNTIQSDNSYIQNRLETYEIITGSLFANSISSSVLNTNQLSSCDLKVQFINNDVYPPFNIVVNPDVSIDTLVVANTISSFSTFINTISANTIIIDTSEIDATLVNTVSTNALFLNTLESKQIINNIFDTQLLSTNSLTISSGNVSTTIANSLFTKDQYINTLYVNAISTNTFYGSILTTSTLQTDSISSAKLESDQLYVSSLYTDSLVVSLIDTEQLTNESTVVDLFSTNNLNAAILNSLVILGEFFSTDKIFVEQNDTPILETDQSIVNFLQSSNFYGSTIAISSLSTFVTEANAVNFSTFIISTVNTVNTLINTSFLSSLNTNLISSKLIDIETSYLKNAIVDTLSSAFLITNELFSMQEFGLYVSTGIVAAKDGYVSSLQASTVNIEVFDINTAYVSSLETNKILTDTINISSLYFNTLEISSATILSISTTSMYASSISTHSISTSTIYSDYSYTDISIVSSISSYTTYASDIVTNLLKVNENLTANRLETFGVSTSTTIAQDLLIKEIFFSSINNTLYPPTFKTVEDLTLQTIQVKDYTDGSSTFTLYLSTNVISKSEIIVNTLYASNLSIPILYVQSAELNAIQLSTLSTTVYLGQESFFYSSFINQLSSQLTNIDRLEASSIQVYNHRIDTLSSIEANINYYSSHTMSTNSIIVTHAFAETSYSDSVSTSLIEGNLYTDTLQINIFQGEVINTSSITGLDTTTNYVSTFTFFTSTFFTTKLDSYNTNTEKLYSISTFLSSLFMNTGTIQAMSSILIDSVSTNVNTLSNTIMIINSSTFTESLVTNFISANTAYIHLTNVESIVSPFISTGLLSNTLVNTQTYNSSNLSTASLNVLNYFTSSVAIGLLSTTNILVQFTEFQNVSTNTLIASTLTTSYGSLNFISPTAVSTILLETSTLYGDVINDKLISSTSINGSLLNTNTITTYILDTTFLNSEYISSHEIIANTISSHSIVVYGSNTLIVQGSTILSDALFVSPSLRANSIAANKIISGVTNPGQIATLSSLDTNLVSSGNTFTTLFNLSSLQVSILSTAILNTQDLYISSLEAIQISTNLFTAGAFYGSSIYADSFIVQSNIGFVSNICSYFLIAQNTYVSKQISTTTLSSVSTFINYLETQSLSSSNLVAQTMQVDQMNGIAISTNSLSTNTLYTDNLTTFFTSSFYVSSYFGSTNSILTSSLQTQILSTNTLVSKNSLHVNATIKSEYVSSSYILTSNFYGDILSSMTLSTATLIANEMTISSIDSIYISSSSLEGIDGLTSSLQINTISISSIEGQQYTNANEITNTILSTTNVFGSGMETTFNTITTQTISTAFGEIQSLNTIQQNANEISSGKLYTNLLTLNSLSTNVSSLQRLTTSNIFLSTVFINILSTNAIIGTTFEISSIETGNISSSALYSDNMYVSTINASTVGFSILFANIGDFRSIHTNFISTKTLLMQQLFTSTLQANSISSAILATPQTGLAINLTTNIISTATITATSFLNINTVSSLTSITAQTFNISSCSASTISSGFISAGSIRGMAALMDKLTGTFISSGNLIGSSNIGLFNVLNLTTTSTILFIDAANINSSTFNSRVISTGSLYASSFFGNTVNTNLISANFVTIDTARASSINTDILLVSSIRSVGRGLFSTFDATTFETRSNISLSTISDYISIITLNTVQTNTTDITFNTINATSFLYNNTIAVTSNARIRDFLNTNTLNFNDLYVSTLLVDRNVSTSIGFNRRSYIQASAPSNPIIMIAGRRDEEPQRVNISVNGINWSNQNGINGVGNGNIYEVGYLHSVGRFIAVSGGTVGPWYSSNGSNWFAAPLVVSTTKITVKGLGFKNQNSSNNFQAYAINELSSFITTTDGINWVSLASNATPMVGGNARNYIVYSPVADIIVASVGGISNLGFSALRCSRDGINWSNTNITNVTHTGVRNNVRGLAYGNGVFVVSFENAMSNTNSNIYARSTNGSNWTNITATGPRESNQGWSVAYGGKDSNYFLGTSRYSLWRSTNGQTWSSNGINYDADSNGGYRTASLYFQDGAWYALAQIHTSASNLSSYRSTDDGSTWSAINNITFATYSGTAAGSISGNSRRQRQSELEGPNLLICANQTTTPPIINYINDTLTNNNQIYGVTSNFLRFNYPLIISQSNFHVSINELSTFSPSVRMLVNGIINTSNTTQYAPVATWTDPSDRRIKTDIEEADLGLCKTLMRNIPLCTYKLLDSSDTVYGFIAQTVSNYFPKAVVIQPGYGYDDLLTLDQSQINAMHYGATKKLIQEIEEHEILFETLNTSLSNATTNMELLNFSSTLHYSSFIDQLQSYHLLSTTTNYLEGLLSKL